MEAFYLKDKILEDAKKIRCGPLHVGSRVKFQETEKCKVSFMDLIDLPKRIWPTGLGGPKYILTKREKKNRNNLPLVTR